jgi:hypothetical protein
MTKIVYNACYGGFGISAKAEVRYWELKGEDRPVKWYSRDLERDDPILAQVVEELGEEANGAFSDLQIEELEAGTRYRIEEYDGFETVEVESDYSWRIA